MAPAPTDNKPPLIFLLLLLFSVTCSYGNHNQQFINSCGDIHNISFPFQLQGDPSNTCNDSFYTLSCDENNRTVLPLLSGKYYVQSINYTDHSIRLVDVGIQTNNICSSFPLYSFNGNDFFPFGSIADSSWSSVLFLSCEKPVQSPNYINRTRYCNTRDESGNGYYSYVMAGRDVRVRDIADSCVLEVSYISTSRLIRKRGSNLSWLDLNKELGYGFDILWGYTFFCWDLSRCRERAYCCFGDSVNVTAVCSDHEYCPRYKYYGTLWDIKKRPVGIHKKTKVMHFFHLFKSNHQSRVSPSISFSQLLTVPLSVYKHAGTEPSQNLHIHARVTSLLTTHEAVSSICHICYMNSGASIGCGCKSTCQIFSKT